MDKPLQVSNNFAITFKDKMNIKEISAINENPSHAAEQNIPTENPLNTSPPRKELLQSISVKNTSPIADKNRQSGQNNFNHKDNKDYKDYKDKDNLKDSQNSFMKLINNDGKNSYDDVQMDMDQLDNVEHNHILDDSEVKIDLNTNKYNNRYYKDNNKQKKKPVVPPRKTNDIGYINKHNQNRDMNFNFNNNNYNSNNNNNNYYKPNTDLEIPNKKQVKKPNSNTNSQGQHGHGNQFQKVASSSLEKHKKEPHQPHLSIFKGPVVKEFFETAPKDNNGNYNKMNVL